MHLCFDIPKQKIELAHYSKWHRAKTLLISFDLTRQFTTSFFQTSSDMLLFCCHNKVEMDSIWVTKPCKHFQENLFIEKSFIGILEISYMKDSCSFLQLWLLGQFLCGYKNQKVPEYSVPLNRWNIFLKKCQHRNW